MGLEWNYTPETEEFTDGESKTQSSITQKINYKIPVADFYFKYKAQDGNDLSVVIRAPSTVYRGDNYSFTVTYMNNGNSAAYDVPLKGTVDDILVEEIAKVQDFSANISKTYTIKRIADTAANEIHLWANIGVPEGFIDGNLSNNTATAVIKVIDPEPEPTLDEPDIPDKPDDPVNPPDEPSVLPEHCDLTASFLAPRTVYEYEDYSYTVSFTNNSDVELKAVALQGKSNDNILSEIPKTASFKSQETKTFTITGTAGGAGEIYSLWANVKAPEGFRDEKPANNTAVSSITVIKHPP